MISALLLIGAFTFEARSLPSRAYRHYCIKSAINDMVSALQLTLHLAALAGDLAMAVSWVAGNENHDEATGDGSHVCRIPTNLPSLKPNALMYKYAWRHDA